MGKVEKWDQKMRARGRIQYRYVKTRYIHRMCIYIYLLNKYLEDRAYIIRRGIMRLDFCVTVRALVDYIYFVNYKVSGTIILIGSC